MIPTIFVFGQNGIHPKSQDACVEVVVVRNWTIIWFKTLVCKMTSKVVKQGKMVKSMTFTKEQIFLLTIKEVFKVLSQTLKSKYVLVNNIEMALVPDFNSKKCRKP